MSINNNLVFIGSASLAIAGTVAYHNFIKLLPKAIDPFVSVFAIYIFVIIISSAVFPFFVRKEEILSSLRLVNWVQLGIAIAVVCMELGFLLMYRHGWTLSLGNLVTGVVINAALLLIGTLFFKETISNTNAAGILFSIVGISMIAYRDT